MINTIEFLLLCMSFQLNTNPMYSPNSLHYYFIYKTKLKYFKYK